MDKLRISLENYQQALEKIQRDRSLWSDVSVIIRDTLVEVTESSSFPVDWEFFENSDYENSHVLGISFNPTVSGIGKKNSNAFKKYGGQLIFIQGYNSRVQIAYKNPYIEELMLESNFELVETIDVDSVTKDTILLYISDFLDAMTKWENTNLTNPIGFIQGV